jgi:hypothetical protein
MKLTKHSVAELDLPPGKNELVEWSGELPGFGVRLRRSTLCLVRLLPLGDGRGAMRDQSGSRHQQS